MTDQSAAQLREIREQADGECQIQSGDTWEKDTGRTKFAQALSGLKTSYSKYLS